jgi:hypothetical protein
MESVARRVLRSAAAVTVVALASIALLWVSAVPGTWSGGARAGAAPNETAQARKALLVFSDMPSGWIKTKAPNNNSTVGASQLAHCIGVAKSLITENPPSVHSPQFQNRQGTLMVNDNVTVFPSAKNATAEFGTVANAKTAGCLTAVASGPLKSKFLGTFPKGFSAGTPLVSPTDSATFGAGTAGYSLSVPVTARGVTLNLTVTSVFAVKGRLGHQITFTSVGLPFSIGLERHLSSVAVGRL